MKIISSVADLTRVSYEGNLAEFTIGAAELAA
jgi:hypothetical protein